MPNFVRRRPQIERIRLAAGLDTTELAAIERYAGNVYIQRNPTMADGKEAFIAYFTPMAQEYPGKHVYLKRVIAERDTVVLHCHHGCPGDSDWPGIDILRLDDNGKIAEHWDVLPPVSEQPANDNMMF